MKELTHKQQRMLDFIADFTAEQGMPPTVSEIAESFRIRGPTAYAHLRALQRKGYISRSSKARSLTLRHTEKPKHFSLTLSVPVLGRISAGLPLFAEEQVEETLQVDAGFLPSNAQTEGNVFGLKVLGDSMRDAGILDGDILLARHTQIADDGEIVVALVENETTVKYLHLTEKGVELHPANPQFATQIYPPDSVRIQGVGIGLQRTF